MYKEERTRRGFFKSDTMVGGEEMIDSDVTQGEEVKKEEEVKKKDEPDIIVSMLGKVIDTILLEEMTAIGLKMNKYRGILAKAILEFAEEHQDEDVNLLRLVDSFRAGWKAYRQRENEEVAKKVAVDVFMEAMNNRLWIPKSDVIAE